MSASTFQDSRCRFRAFVMWLVGCGLVWLFTPAPAQPAQQDGRPRRVRPPVSSVQPDASPRPAAPAEPALEQRARNLPLAQELLALTKLPTICERKMLSVLLKEIRTTPEMRGYTDIIRDFFQQHVSASLMSEEMARYLVENFSERELLQLKAIVGTSAGQKMFSSLENLPEAERLNDADYLQLFDEEETRQHQVFSRLPAFQKFSDCIPTLIDLGGEVTKKRLDAHLPDLMDDLMRRMQERPPLN
ncbi:hypothetical protein [Chloracidobacterium thermophilum]|uniref:hypothetical protein n=1 Tax=Chloracidobacterium thermophilum TaxID=458033 RepID=UPI0007385385|nr:hypothetical protein [Chloracidobacterium thermophilum]